MSHKHHIHPRHLGGTDDPENLVEVEVDEHARIHHSLWILGGRWQDELAWRTLSGQIGREEANLLALRASKLGKPRSLETRKKVSEAMKGRVPWNKGKTKETDPILAENSVKISKHHTGKKTGPCSPQRAKAISEAKLRNAAERRAAGLPCKKRKHNGQLP